MASQLMIYGATGYSLGLAVEEAKREGLDFIIGGRTSHKVMTLAQSLNVNWRVFSPDDPPDIIDKGMTGLKLFVNGAGPFQKSTGPFMDACIRNGVHYIDISAELDSYQAAAQRDDDAKRAGVTLLPAGAAGVEVILDCLAGRLLERTTSPIQVEQVLNIHGPLSRGTIGTIRGSPAGAVKRVNGELVQHDTGSVVDFNDGRGSLPCFPTNDPQIITLWKATGVPNISSVCCKTGGDLPDGDLDTIPIGPSAAERAETPYHAAVTVRSADGTVNRSVVRMPNGYDLVALGTVQAAKRILGGQHALKPGFQTPYMAFGSDYLSVFAGTTVVDY